MQTTLREIVLDMRSLEPFPKVATAVLSISNRPGVVPEEIIEVVQTDPAITGKVLKLCNSAYYGFQREIGSLSEAGNRLGVQTLVNLVLTSSANKYFRTRAGGNEAHMESLWSRSLTQAIASRLIAEQHGYESPDRAYTAGLMQNIGEIVIGRHYESEFLKVRAEVAKGRTPLQAERVIMGIHHAEIGARLTSDWKLPPFLVDTIRYHHQPEGATVDPLLTSTVHLAETMIAMDAIGPERLPFDVCEAALELTGLNPGDFEAIQMSLDQELKRAQEWIGA